MKRVAFILAVMSLATLHAAACDSGSEPDHDCAAADCDGVGDGPDFETTVDPGLDDGRAGDDAEIDPVDTVIEEDVDTPIDGPDEDPVMEDVLSAAELAKIDDLRLVIESGLLEGQDLYLERVSLTFQTYDVAMDYQSQLDDPAVGLHEEPAECPYEDALDNGFEADEVTCNYLITLADADAQAEADKRAYEMEMARDPDDEATAEFDFWTEMGIISGIEDQRTRVRADVTSRGLCNPNPSPVESSHITGVLVGRQLFAARFNTWLSDHGHKADYPEMTQKITVCNADLTMLAPARKQAHDLVDAAIAEHPLCGEDYEPPTTMDAHLHFAEAQIQFRNGIEVGIDDEHALAAVRVFHVVPCNVSDPLVVDLDGDGIELRPIHRGVNFDFWASDHPTAVAWTDRDDGLLAIDRDGDGVIGDGSELFGNISGDVANGFEDLARLDAPDMGGDGSGALDAGDAAFGQLVVWRDADIDGRTDAGELLSLVELGVTSIPLAAADVEMHVAGQPVTAVAYATTTAGPPLWIGDAWFRTAPHARVSAR